MSGGRRESGQWKTGPAYSEPYGMLGDQASTVMTSVDADDGGVEMREKGDDRYEGRQASSRPVFPIHQYRWLSFEGEYWPVKLLDHDDPEAQRFLQERLDDTHVVIEYQGLPPGKPHVFVSETDVLTDFTWDDPYVLTNHWKEAGCWDAMVAFARDVFTTYSWSTLQKTYAIRSFEGKDASIVSLVLEECQTWNGEGTGARDEEWKNKTVTWKTGTDGDGGSSESDNPMGQRQDTTDWRCVVCFQLITGYGTDEAEAVQYRDCNQCGGHHHTWCAGYTEDNKCALCSSGDTEGRQHSSSEPSECGDWFRRHRSQVICGSVVVLCIGLLLTVILVPSSFKTVDANEVGLRYDEVTKELGTEPFYEGLYNLGPSGTFIKFPTTQLVSSFTTSCFTSDGLQVTVTEEVAYSLTISEVRTLVDNWVTLPAMEEFLKSLFISKTLDVCTMFTVRQFWKQRHLVQKQFYDTLIEEVVTFPVDLQTVQLLDVTFGPSVEKPLLETTEAEQDVNNAEVERDTKMLDAEIALKLSTLQAEITLIDARKDAEVTKLQSDQEVLRERSKLIVYAYTFGNVTKALGVDGTFFVEQYLPRTVFQQSLESHRVMQL